MKITSITYSSNYTAFDVFIEFELWETTWPEPSLEKINEVCKWCGETFKDNYIMLEISEAIISGGNTNNVKNWNGRLNKNHTPAPTGEYQLRCSQQDCTIFLLKYKGKE